VDEPGAAAPYLGDERVDVLAVAALVGVNPVALLTADPPLRHELERVVVSAHNRTLERDRWFARQIIVELVDALNRK
jgi:hypothetical protein